MDFTIWGARGSIPVSGPEYNRYGGDTTCIEVRTAGGERIVVDAGTGIRLLGKALVEDPRSPRTLHFFVTHAHWDHIMGFPFFKPIYRPEYTIHLQGCTNAQESIRSFFQEAMHPPFFPVNLDDARADLRFSGSCSEEFLVGEVRVLSFPLNHPNQGYGFRFDEGGKSFAFFPDNELAFAHPGGRSFDELAEFVHGVDWLLHDAEYRPEEYEAFSRGWGHSVHLDAVRLAIRAQVKNLVLWHLNQERSDDEVDAMEEEARRAVLEAGSKCRVLASRTGLHVNL